jgi:hypothetical protein
MTARWKRITTRAVQTSAQRAAGAHAGNASIARSAAGATRLSLPGAQSPRQQQVKSAVAGIVFRMLGGQ